MDVEIAGIIFLQAMGRGKNRFCQKEKEAIRETQIKEENCKDQINQENLQLAENFSSYALGNSNRYRRCY
jgi:hypothetical protein